jgi:hypothetical protein
LIGESAKVAKFDSTTSMLLALARFLDGRDLRNLGLLPAPLEPLALAVASAINLLPQGMRVKAYQKAARLGAVDPGSLGDLDGERIARWFVSHYPKRRYPAVFVGASNGAALHLAAALGAPWLPQNSLVAVSHPPLDVDEPTAFLEWGRGPGRLLLAANPHLRLHHMADPAQDRPMLSEIAYFRLKRLRLGKAYERFLADRLAPGGTIFLVDCRLRWPTTEVGERHVFQFGGVGALTPEQYRQGGIEVAHFLGRQGSEKLSWDPPAADAEREEAEWGFVEELGADVERFAERRGFRVRRVVFDDPQDLSPLQAELYRWWYGRLGRPADLLLAQTFNLVQPYWALRTSSVPFWLTFNMKPDQAALEEYVRAHDGYRRSHLVVLSNAVEAPGLVQAAEWEQTLSDLTGDGGLLGTDENKYPRDFGTFVRHVRDLRRTIERRFPLPASLSLEEFDEFLSQRGTDHPKVAVTP